MLWKQRLGTLEHCGTIPLAVNCRPMYPVGDSGPAVLPYWRLRIFKRKKLHPYAVAFAESGRFFVAKDIHQSLDVSWVKHVSEYTGTQHYPITISLQLLDNLLVPIYISNHPSFGQRETAIYLLVDKTESNRGLSGSRPLRPSMAIPDCLGLMAGGTGKNEENRRDLVVACV